MVFEQADILPALPDHFVSGGVGVGFGGGLRR